MNLDLNNLLEGWPHEPGQIRVRKIIGSDGREKLQLRIDLGLIQMEASGRPDGTRPHGRESLLTWHQERAAEAETNGAPFVLSGDECGDLQQEAIQYYHRYISLFQLGDYTGVIRDTQRNLDLLEFTGKYTDQEDLAWSFEQFRPYMMMMNTRARASIELERHDFAAAMELIEKGRNQIQEVIQSREEAADQSPEVEFLSHWLEELRSKRPLSRLEQLEKEMAQAIAAEAYERAAEIRDKIKAAKEE